MSAPVAETDTVLAALDRETTVLLDHVLAIFLEFDFLDHRLIDGASGGEIVTHLAREADRMADELARGSGQELIPVDPEREWSIAQNGGMRPGAVLVHDLHESTGRLRAAIAGIADWTAVPPHLRGIPAHRLLQVIVHAADLGRPWGDIPEGDVATALAVLPAVLDREHADVRLAVRPDLDEVHATWHGGAAVIEGPPRRLLEWATGRVSGVELPEVARRTLI